MGRIHPALIDLAAGRPLRAAVADRELVASALEHRLAGLLWTRVTQGEVRADPPWRDRLLDEDLRNWGRHQVLWDGLVRITRRLESLGVRVASLKGVTAEARWYGRMGERPCSDIDLLLAPDDTGRISDIVRELVPAHPLQRSLQELVDGKHIQAVELIVDGIPVDLHLDPLKLEVVPTRRPELFWQRVIPFQFAGGATLYVLDAETSLIQFLTHLTKDRFAYLLGYADVARICALERLDWPSIDRLVREEAVETPVYLALDAVVHDLRLRPIAHPPVRGLHATLWRRLWPASSRLRGYVARTGSRFRQLWLPLTARGMLRAATRGYVSRLFPPRALIEHQTPHTPGPYMWRITIGRVRNARRRRERNLRKQPDSV